MRLIWALIFGAERFQTEIAWCYREAINSRKRWNRKHDTLLFYCKSADFYLDWQSVAGPRQSGTHMKMAIDADGREYQGKEGPQFFQHD